MIWMMYVIAALAAQAHQPDMSEYRVVSRCAVIGCECVADSKEWR